MNSTLIHPAARNNFSTYTGSELRNFPIIKKTFPLKRKGLFHFSYKLSRRDMLF